MLWGYFQTNSQINFWVPHNPITFSPVGYLLCSVQNRQCTECPALYDASSYEVVCTQRLIWLEYHAYSFNQTPWVLFFSLLVFEGGDYSRAVSIRRNIVPSYNTSNSRHSGWRHKLLDTSLEHHYVSYTCNHNDQNMIKVTQILLTCRTRPTTCMGTEFLKRKINTKPVAFCMVFTHCQVHIKCWFVCIH